MMAGAPIRILLPALLLTLLLLLLLVELLPQSGCLLLPLLLLPVAIPLWLARRERWLYPRRLLLSAAVAEQASLRRWFWHGRFGAVIDVIVVLPLAAVLLALLSELTPFEWLLLLLDIPLLLLLMAVSQRTLQRQLRPAYQSMVNRRLMLWGNSVLLALLLFGNDFWLSGAVDLRNQSWYQLVEQTLADRQAYHHCPLFGLLTGLIGGYEQGVWALAQQLIPYHLDPSWRWLAWPLLLLGSGLLSYLLTLLLLGVVILVQRQQPLRTLLGGDSTILTSAFATLLLLSIGYWLLLWQIQKLPPTTQQALVEQAQAQLDPCYGGSHASAALRQRLDDELMQRRDQRLTRQQPQIEAELEQLFADVETGVDAYLDWYFTVIGEYERIAALAASDLPTLMAEQLEQHLFIETDFTTRLELLDQRLISDTERELGVAAREDHQQLLQQALANPCLLGQLTPATLQQAGDRDLMRASNAVASGAAVGVTTAVMAKKIVASLVAKVTAKKTVQAATVLAMKFAAKRGGGAVAATVGALALCSPSGPVAVVCGIIAGTGAWLAVDKISIEIDEEVSREAMRREIMEAVTEEKQLLIDAMQLRHRELVEQMATAVQRQRDDRFIPARDGL